MPMGRHLGGAYSNVQRKQRSSDSEDIVTTDWGPQPSDRQIRTTMFLLVLGVCCRDDRTESPP